MRAAAPVAVAALLCTVVNGILPAGATPRAANDSPGAEGAAPSATSPVLGEAEHEYTTMTATRYQHHNREDAAAGTYFYDCVGFITYVLGRAAPVAHSTAITTLAIRPGYVPSPARYVHFLGGLDGDQAGWSPVHNVGDLRAGDIVAWSYDHPKGSNGHAFVVGAAPRSAGAHSYLVEVWDSTVTPHGPDDTRRTNPKNLPGPSGKPSGLGHGTVRIDANADGALATVHWSPTSKPVPAARFASGRPTG